MAEDVLGVHDFRAAVSDLLERFRADPSAEPVVVGAYRRREAVLLPATQFDALVRSGHVGEDHPDLPAIRAQLARSPEERLAGLAAGAAFFAAARRVE